MAQIKSLTSSTTIGGSVEQATTSLFKIMATWDKKTHKMFIIKSEKICSTQSHEIAMFFE